MPIALISGATSGFGYETAIALNSKDYKLIIIARREDQLKKLVKKLGDNVYFKAVDVTNEKAIKGLISNLPIEYKDIDVLVNSAGIALGLETADTCSIDDWEKMIDTNIKGTLYLTRYVLPIMKLRNSGYIINIGSTAGHVPYKGGNVYGATKAFINQFSRNLRTDLLGTQIRVTCIEPGAAQTGFSIARFKGDIDRANAVYQGMNPLQAVDIADTIAWLVDRPLHVNIDNIEIMPLDQTWGGLAVNRKG